MKVRIHDYYYVKALVLKMLYRLKEAEVMYNQSILYFKFE